MMSNVFWGLAVPFIGTSLGAACVFFMKEALHRGTQRCLTGFAAGIMVAASFFSLILPALDMSEDMGRWAFVPAVVGFGAGVAFLLLLDHAIPHLHMNTEKAEGPAAHLAKGTMLVLAVTLHNIPEGMAVGCCLRRLSGRKRRYYRSGSNGARFGNCHTELSRRRHYIHAPQGRRYGKNESLYRRRFIRRG